MPNDGELFVVQKDVLIRVVDLSVVQQLELLDRALHRLDFGGAVWCADCGHFETVSKSRVQLVGREEDQIDENQQDDHEGNH